MQFRFTLSEEDAVEGVILKEVRPLNVRRRSEYFRKILAKGFLAELAERELLARSSRANISRDRDVSRDYDESSTGKETTGGLRSERLATSLRGIFQDQSEALMFGRRAAVTEEGRR